MNRYAQMLVVALASAATLAHAATKPPAATQAQRTIAQDLKNMTGKGQALAGVYKRSIKPANIIVRGKAGPITGDFGNTLGFEVTGLEKRDGLGGLRSFIALQATGQFVTESFAGPYVKLGKVTELRAPSQALE